MIYHCLKYIEEEGHANGSQHNLLSVNKPPSFTLFLQQTLSVIRAAPLTSMTQREQAALKLKRKMILFFFSLMMTDLIMITLNALGYYILFKNYDTELTAIISSWITVRVFVMIELLDCFLNGLKNVSSSARHVASSHVTELPTVKRPTDMDQIAGRN